MMSLDATRQNSTSGAPPRSIVWQHVADHLNSVDKQRRTPMHYVAASSSHSANATISRRRPTISQSNDTTTTEATAAQCAQLLLTNGAGVVMRDCDGCMPLHVAVYCNNGAIIDKLLAAMPVDKVDTVHGWWRCGHSRRQCTLAHLAAVVENGEALIPLLCRHVESAVKQVHQAQIRQARKSSVSQRKAVMLSEATEEVTEGAISPSEGLPRRRSSIAGLTLLAHWTAAEIMDAYDRTPMHYAAAAGNLSVLRALIEQCRTETSPTTALHEMMHPDRYSLTPIHHAAAHGHIECLYELVVVQQLPIIHTRQPEPAFLLALSSCVHSTHLLGALLTAMDIDIHDSSQRSIWHYAATSNNVAVIKALNECRRLRSPGSNPILARCAAARTPLHYAALCDATESVKALCAILVEINDDKRPVITVDNLLCTPMHYAAFNGNIAIVAELAAHVQCVDSCIDGCWSPLHCAIYAGHTDVLPRLLQCTENIDEEIERPIDCTMSTLDIDGCRVETAGRTTLTHLLAQRNCARAAHLLLDTIERQNKAIVLRDSAQHTPLHIAAANDCTRIIDCITGTDEDTNVRNLLTVTDAGNNTPLHLACQYNASSMALCLVQLMGTCSYEEMNARNGDGYTCMALAARSYNSELMTALFRAGADVDVSDPSSYDDAIDVSQLRTANAIVATARDPRAVDALATLVTMMRLQINELLESQQASHAASEALHVNGAEQTASTLSPVGRTLSQLRKEKRKSSVASTPRLSALLNASAFDAPRHGKRSVTLDERLNASA